MAPAQTSRLGAVARCTGTARRPAVGGPRPAQVAACQRQRRLAPPPRTPAVGGRRRSQVLQASEVSKEAAVDEEQGLSLELFTADVQAAVRLMALPQGRGTAIVVAAVEPGSEAARAGVRCGQQLLAVSDPIRFSDTWQLNERASLKYVRQCISMRRAQTIFLQLSAQPIPEWYQAVADARAAAAAERAGEAPAAVTPAAVAAVAAAASAQPAGAAGASSGGSMDESDLLTAIVQQAEATRSGSFDASASVDDARFRELAELAEARQLTVAERLELQYQQQQEQEADAAAVQQVAAQQMSALQKRVKRRKEYFEQSSQRNDGPFFAAVGALFVVPPAAILLYAYSSGYLEQLDTYGLLR